MSEDALSGIRELLAQCSQEEQQELFNELRQHHRIHEFEDVIGASAEVILDAVHRAPELTRRNLRGVIADAAFRRHVAQPLSQHGWKDVTPEGNYAYDYKLADEIGDITIQVKLQRSKAGLPSVEKGSKYGFEGEVYTVETQKTRKGKDRDGNETRFYRYGQFDILAVSMQPSANNWDQYMYTLQRWLLPHRRPNSQPGEIAVMQPVAMQPDEFWTDDFTIAARWFRAEDKGKNMSKLMQHKSRRSS